MTITTQLVAMLPLVDQPDNQEPPGMGGIGLIVSWIFWAVAIICLVGVAVGAAQLVFGERHGEFNGAKRIILPLVAAVISGSAAALINAVAGA